MKFLTALCSLALTTLLLELIWNYCFVSLPIGGNPTGPITYWQALGVLVFINIISAPFRSKGR